MKKTKDDVDAVREKLQRKNTKISNAIFRIKSKDGKIKNVNSMRRVVNHPKYGDIFYLILINYEEVKVE